MPKTIDYCSLEPVYPKKAFMLFLFVLHRDQVLGIVPVDSIYTTPAAAAKGVRQTVNQFETMDREITIPDECLMVPLNRISLYPLRKEFWTKPSITYDSQMRMKTFTKAYEHPAFYSLLVTPYAFDDKSDTWYLHAALPLINHDDNTVIERFMYASDQVVEPRAKNAAIYKMGEKLRFNWQTKEIKRFDSTAKKLTQADN